MKRRLGAEDYKGKTNAELSEMAYEDTICDALESMMAEEATFKEFADQYKQKDLKGWKKLKSIIADFLNKLTAWLKPYANVKAETEMGRVIQSATEAKEQIRKFYVSAFLGADENYQKASSQNGSKESSSHSDARESLRIAYTNGKYEVVDKPGEVPRQDVEAYIKKAISGELKDTMQDFTTSLLQNTSLRV